MNHISSDSLVSVIIATRNRVAELGPTLDSIATQVGEVVECIVVDGASHDGTRELLAGRSEPGLRWISEPDRGLYDAWNKGVTLARGEWLLFLGAGDRLADPSVIADLAPTLRQAAGHHGFVYGRLGLLSPNGALIEEWGRPWDEIAGHWEIGRPALPPHGAVFHHRSLFYGQESFDLRYPIAADSHFLLRHIGDSHPLYLTRRITEAPIGGVSLDLRTAHRVAEEIRAINRELGLKPPLAHRLGDALRLGLIHFLALLPPTLAHRLADKLRQLAGKPTRWSIE